MRRLPVPFALLVLLSALFCAAAGASSHSPRLTEARAPFPDRAYVLSLPSRERLDPSTVQVLEDGRPVSDLTVVPSGGQARQFGIVLLIDASNSMRGKPIAAAMAAARAFARERSGEEQLAVVAFNGTENVLLKFTNDGAVIDKALTGQPALALGTHIYDGVMAGLPPPTPAHTPAGAVLGPPGGAGTGGNATQAPAAPAPRPPPPPR